jgi:hypothetical protein
MPRWLLVSVLALLLSCLGFGAAAAQSCNSHAQTASAFPFDDGASGDSADASFAPGEAASDHVEAIGGCPDSFAPALFSQPAPQPAATNAPSPSIDRLRRPPRGDALIA